jgi:hypothetical protein
VAAVAGASSPEPVLAAAAVVRGPPCGRAHDGAHHCGGSV